MKHLIYLLFYLVIFSSSSTFAENIATYSVTGVAENDYLNVREQASANSPIITRIPYDGTGIERINDETDDTGNWWKIRWQNKQGWVNKHYLTAATGHKPKENTQKGDKAALSCGGVEPFWGLKITKTQMTYMPMDGEKITLPITYNQTSENDTSLAAIYAEKNKNRITAFLAKVPACSDGMSDIEYPYSISVLINKKHVYSGCCHIK